MNRPTMPRDVRKKHARRFVKFCIVGASSTLVQMAGLQIVRHIFNSDATSVILWGNAAGFLFAVLNGFYWNRRWTFRRHREPGAGGEFVRFAAVSVVGLTLNTGLLYLFYDRLRLFEGLPHSPLLNQLLTIAIVVFWNFTANTKWSFAAREPAPPV